jgi:heme exporter protein C
MTSPSVAAPGRALPRPVVDWLLWIAVALVAGVYVRAIYFTPLEALQGPSQKIYYIHLGAVTGGYLAFSLVAVMSLVHLWLRDDRADRLAAAACEVAIVFFTVILITGPLWARPIWGAWWSWELRTTLTLLLWFLGLGYLIMRGAIEDQVVRARYSAVLGLMQALLLPFIHLSVYLVKAMHPMPILLKPAAPSLPREMLTTLLFSLASFALLSITLVRARYRLSLLEELTRQSSEVR